MADEEQLIGLWLGGERWLRSHGKLISAFVFFHFRDKGEAVISIRADDSRVPRRVHGRWWVESDELVLALGGGDIRAPFSVHSGILYWADEILVRRAEGSQGPPVPRFVPPKPPADAAADIPLDVAALQLGD
ncbi:MAG: hypothetical protein ABI333_06115 [bacterium]